MTTEACSAILANVERYVSLSNNEREAFADIIDETAFKRRQFLVQPGFVCTHQLYVVEGTLRSYAIDPDGNDHTIQFAIEDWFISDFNSYIKQEPATLIVEALSDGIVHRIDHDKLEDLCLSYPVFERYFRMISQRAFAFAQRRILAGLQMTAEERYMQFMEMYPMIAQRVPQYALASYLGMSPEFLSKIRKRSG